MLGIMTHHLTQKIMNLSNQHSEMTHLTLIKEHPFKSKPRAGHKTEPSLELGKRHLSQVNTSTKQDASAKKASQPGTMEHLSRIPRSKQWTLRINNMFPCSDATSAHSSNRLTNSVRQLARSQQTFKFFAPLLRL